MRGLYNTRTVRIWSKIRHPSAPGLVRAPLPRPHKREDEGGYRARVRTLSDFTEFGHGLIRLEDGNYRFLTASELKKERLQIDGKYQVLPIGQTYLEHVVGGPWAAQAFASYVKDAGKLGALIEHYRVTGPEGAGRINAISTLSQGSVADRSKQVPEDIARRLNSSLTDPKRYLPPGNLQDLAISYNQKLAHELGTALFALGTKVPGTIVLGSSMAEYRADDSDFMQHLRQSAGSVGERIVISKIRVGAQREVASVAW